MTESTYPSLVQQLQLNRGLTEKVLDKATTDPRWKQRLLDDPEAAMREADFPELRRLRQADQRVRAARQEEVRGQVGTTGYGGGDEAGLTIGTTGGCVLYCYYHTLWVRWVCR